MSANVIAQSNFYSLVPPNFPAMPISLIGLDNNEKVYCYSDTLYTYQNNTWGFDPLLNSYHPQRILFDSTNTGWFFSSGELYSMASGSPPFQVSSNLSAAYSQLLISDIYLDANENKWACGRYLNGLMGIIIEYNNQTGFIIDTFPLNTVIQNYPKTIRVNANGDIYLLANSLGSEYSLYSYKNNNYLILDSANFGLFPNFWEIDINPSGNLVILGVDSVQGHTAIVTYNGTGYLKFIDITNLISNLSFSAMHVARNGDVWIIDDIYVYKFDGITITQYISPNGITFFSSPDFLFSKKGLIYTWDTQSLFPTIIFNEYGFNAINGAVFNDLNSDGVQQSGEYGIGNQKVSVQPTNDFTFSGFSGEFHIPLLDTIGSYTASCVAPSN